MSIFSFIHNRRRQERDTETVRSKAVAEQAIAKRELDEKFEELFNIMDATLKVFNKADKGGRYEKRKGTKRTEQ